MAGRAFYIDFPYNNLNTTVYVNGVLCGFEKNPFVRFQIDVTRASGRAGERDLGRHPRRLLRPVGRPGASAEAAQDIQHPAEVLRRRFPGPGLSGLELPAVGHPRHADVGGRRRRLHRRRVREAVGGQQALDAEVTVRNTSAKDAAGEIRWEAVDEKTGEVEHTFPAAGRSV